MIVLTSIYDLSLTRYKSCAGESGNGLLYDLKFPTAMARTNGGVVVPVTSGLCNRDFLIAPEAHKGADIFACDDPPVYHSRVHRHRSVLLSVRPT